MRHVFLLFIGLALVAAGCSKGDVETTGPSQFPTGSVRTWFDAMQDNDTAAVLELTYEASMVVILSAENGLQSAETASLLRRGASAASAEDYLGVFARALRSRYGGDLKDVSVDGFTPLSEIYAAVDITGDGAATILTRRASGGVWQIDLVGTLGPALISQIRAMLEDAGDDADGESIRYAYITDVLPALEAASADQPENLNLAAEIRVMRSLLGSA